MRKTALALLFLMVSESSVLGQSAADARFSAGLSGGLGTGSHRTGGTLGVLASAAVSPRLDAECETTYADRGPGVDALAFEGRMVVSLAARDARFVPQMVLGAAVYRARFDLNDRGMFGQFAQMPGARVAYGPGPGPGAGSMPGGPYGGYGSMWTGPQGAPFTMPHVPDFYARRMGAFMIPQNGMMDRRTFTDPGAVFGGGVTINASKRVYLRPDARALMVFGDGDTYTLGFFTMRVGFRF